MLPRLLLLLAAALLAGLPQWWLPEWRGTEGRRVQIALEMLRDGDWLIPTLGGEPTWAKPPLHYWLLATLCDWFGPERWAMRLPAVLSVVAAALAALLLLARHFGARAGWTAAFGIACAPLVVHEWPTAEIDPLFASLTAISLWTLATGVARGRAALVLLSGLLGGLALLQKGPPYFLFAVGAYLVWWRRTGLRMAWLHFLPLLVVPLCWLVPLLLLRDLPSEAGLIASQESIGRLAGFSWLQVLDVPLFWLRAAAIQLPLLLWCFWEWRGARDARMDAADLTLRMCSGAAVLAIALMSCFPARPTRYILPNILLFTFAVAPAVAHYAARSGELGKFSRRVLRGLGVLGALALPILPLVPELGLAAAVPALLLAIGKHIVRTPRALVLFCLLLPPVASWSVGWQRSLHWSERGKARAAAGQLLREELQERGAAAANGACPDLTWHGHLQGPLLLGTGLLPRGHEAALRAPQSRFVLHEQADHPPAHLSDYAERLRLCVPGDIFCLRERIAGR